MAVLPVGIGSEVAAGGYQIERSLRFNSADSAYLNRTFGTATDRKKWTLSVWAKFKNKTTSERQNLLDAGAQSMIGLAYGTDWAGLHWYDQTAGTAFYGTRLCRDPGAWMHIFVVYDSTQATAIDRIKFYVNNIQDPRRSGDDIALNAVSDINSATAHTIGRSVTYGQPLDGYLAEYHFVDGQALAPTDFGEFNSTTGVWQPIEYTGSYGTNGFYLDFADNTSTTTLGYDAAGSNNWTLNNFSVTAGAGNDSLVDSPTRYGTDTGAGGEVRGNYNTINPLDKGSGLIISNGNLDHLANSSGNWYQARSTIAIPASGKWYWEFTFTSGTASWCSVGMAPSTIALTMGFGPGTYGNYYGMTLDGTLYANNASTGSYGSSFTSGDVLMVAFDRDNSKIYFGKNGTWFNSSNPATQTNPAASSISTTATLFPSVGAVNSSGGSSNFGARPFAYTAPSGFKALCTTNLPEPTIADGSQHFDVVLRNGTGADATISLAFQPGFIWNKGRNAPRVHNLYDIVRGPNRDLRSSLTNAETDDTVANDTLKSFNSNGYTVGSDAISSRGINLSGDTYVDWVWKAGGSGVSNTDGSITSTVSANTDSGFSIVTYTGTGSAATVGHGLGVAPGMIIVKARSSAVAWQSFHQSLGKDRTLQLNETDTGNTVTDYWGTSAPNSTVFGVIGGGYDNNLSGVTTVAYCFAPISGFSSMGSYVGNGSTDGPFVFTNHRPAFLLIKATGLVESWYMVDNARNTYNVVDLELNPNNSGAEATYTVADFLSNGFKLRQTDPGVNQSGQTYIYMAFAENPFAYSLAR